MINRQMQFLYLESLIFWNHHRNIREEIRPPVFPVRAIVFKPFALATTVAYITSLELPTVLGFLKRHPPITISHHLLSKHHIAINIIKTGCQGTLIA